jgi:hypothetical protein
MAQAVRGGARPGAGRVLQGYFQGGYQRLTVLAHHAAAVRRAGTPAQAHRPGVQAQQRPDPQAGTVQRAGGGYAAPLPDGLLSGAGRGQPLPEPVREKMESLFRTDFSDVRVQVGQEAPAIGALAFTLGSTIYFAPGQYSPETTRGHQLLGHELTHVLQQRAGRVSNPFGNGVAVVQDPALEQEAERMGLRAAQPMPAAAQPARRPGAALPGMAAPGPGRPAAQPRTAAQPAGETGYRLVVGTYMHRQESARPLPADLAGHTFVALRRPDGRQEAWGFSPRNYNTYDPQRDYGRLAAGVPGVVHGNADALNRPGVRTRSYPISAEQAQAAEAKVAEYRSGRHEFSLARRPCSAFALDVLHAARADAFPGVQMQPPRSLYNRL